MKQGTLKKAGPTHKHDKPSWKKRNEARKVDQQVYAANLLLAAQDADDAALTAAVLADTQTGENT